MTNDLAKTIASAVLKYTQDIHYTASEDELAEVVRPHLSSESVKVMDMADTDAARLFVIRHPDGEVHINIGGVNFIIGPEQPAPSKCHKVQVGEELPWDKLRDPITDGPEYASTHELYDAHSGRRHTLPSGEFITVDHRGTIRQWDALGNLMTGPNIATPDLCQFAKCGGAVFQDGSGGLRCTCCGRLSTSKTPEAGDGE